MAQNGPKTAQNFVYLGLFRSAHPITPKVVSFYEYFGVCKRDFENLPASCSWPDGIATLLDVDTSFSAMMRWARLKNLQ